MEAIGGHKKGFKLLRSSSEAIARRARRGFNLIEAAIVLAVVGGVIGAIWVGASAVSENFKVNRTKEEILAYATRMQSFMSYSDGLTIGTLAGVDITNIAISSSVLPSNWVNGNTVTNPWGGRVTTHVGLSGPSNSQAYFDILLFDLPKKTCASLAVMMSAISDTSGSNGNGTWDDVGSRTVVRYININNNTLSTQNFPISVSDASTACNTNSSNSLNISFNFTRRNN